VDAWEVELAELGMPPWAIEVERRDRDALARNPLAAGVLRSPVPEELELHPGTVAVLVWSESGYRHRRPLRDWSEVEALLGGMRP